MTGKDRLPQSLLGAGGENIEPAEHQLDIGTARGLHRLQLARQFGCGCLGEGEARDVSRVLGLVGLDRVLQQRERAADVDHVDDDRRLRRLRDGRLAERERRDGEGRGRDQATARECLLSMHFGFLPDTETLADLALIERPP